MTFQGCFLPSFDPFGQAVSEETIFLEITNQKQELPVAAMVVNGWEITNKLAIFIEDLPNFDSFGKAVTEEKIL